MTADWGTFREQMPIVRNWAYLDHAAVAPLPCPTHDAITGWAAEAMEQGTSAWPSWNRKLEETRRLAAGLVGSKTSEIALVRSTTEGISLVAEGLPWQEGDNVITLADEFPSNLYPWMNLGSRGVETRRVATDAGRVDYERLAASCDERTRLIALSWVGYAVGWRNDLDRVAEIAHQRGALLMVDAIQGLGMYPLDVCKTPIDFLAADGHKWLLGPEGAGILFIRHEHLNRLRPIGVGWNSVVHAHDFTHIELKFKDSAARYEGGSPNSVGFIGLGASLKLLAEYGPAAIEQRLLEITDYACERLTSIGAVVASHRGDRRHSSAILAFELPGKDPLELRRGCLAAHVALGCRGGRLRISPHAYTTTEDIDRLVQVLAAAA